MVYESQIEKYEIVQTICKQNVLNFYYNIFEFVEDLEDLDHAPQEY